MTCMQFFEHEFKQLSNRHLTIRDVHSRIVYDGTTRDFAALKTPLKKCPVKSWSAGAGLYHKTRRDTVEVVVY